MWVYVCVFVCITDGLLSDCVARLATNLCLRACNNDDTRLEHLEQAACVCTCVHACMCAF
jgi:hypothetical protein